MADAKLNISVLGVDKAKNQLKSIPETMNKELEKTLRTEKALNAEINNTVKGFSKAAVEADILAKKTALAEKNVKGLASAARSIGMDKSLGRYGAGGGGAGGGSGGGKGGLEALLGGTAVGAGLGAVFGLKRLADSRKKFESLDPVVKNIIREAERDFEHLKKIGQADALNARSFMDLEWTGTGKEKKSFIKRVPQAVPNPMKGRVFQKDRVTDFHSGRFVRESDLEEWDGTVDRRGTFEYKDRKYKVRDLGGRAREPYSLGYTPIRSVKKEDVLFNPIRGSVVSESDFNRVNEEIGLKFDPKKGEFNKRMRLGDVIEDLNKRDREMEDESKKLKEKFSNFKSGAAMGALAVAGAMFTTQAMAVVSSFKSAGDALVKVKDSANDAAGAAADTNMGRLQANRLAIGRLNAAGIDVRDVEKMGIGVGLGGALSKGGITGKELDFVKGAMRAGVSEETLMSDLEGNKRLVGRGLKSYLKSKGIEGLGSVKENRGYLDVAGRGEEADRKLAFAEMRGARGYSGKYEMNQAEKAAVAMDAEGQARAELIGEIAKEKLNIMQVNEYMGWLGFALRKLQAGFGGGADYQSLDAVRRYQAVAP